MPTVSSVGPTAGEKAHAFLRSAFPPKPMAGSLTNAEALDLGRTRLLESLHYYDQVKVLGCDKCTEHKKTTAALEELHAEHDLLKAENQQLLSKLEEATSQNALLLAQLEENRQQMETASLSHRDSEASSRRAMEAEAAARLEVTSLTQQLTEFKTVYSKKVSDLDATCSERQVLITQQQKQLEIQKNALAEVTARANHSSEELVRVQQESLFHQQLAEQSSSDLVWLLEHGIVECVRSVLHSNTFAMNCASLQEASIQLGRVQGCLAMQEKYTEVLGDKGVVYAYDGEKELILERFKNLVEHSYELLSFLADGEVDVEALKKRLGRVGG